MKLRQTAPVYLYVAVSAVLVAVLSLQPSTAAGVVGTAQRQAPRLAWEVVSRRPHDTNAFTQGLSFDRAGRLFESTGLYGASTLRELDPTDGRVLRSVALPDDQFGEGIAVVDDQLVQLTWRNGVATRWDIDSFGSDGAFTYEGEGWGLCHDGERLVMSDGSHRLTFRDDRSFEALATVEVTLDGTPLERLNELECVDGAVWANVWDTDLIVRIDAATGVVDGVLKLSGLIEPHPAIADPKAVLNGIAYDAGADTFLVTGKDWPELIEIRVGEP